MIHIAVFDATERRMYERELVAAKERAERSEAHSQGPRPHAAGHVAAASSCPWRSTGSMSPASTLPPGRVTRSAATSTTCSRSARDDWVIALGDVEGKGVDAAVVTALVRYTIRAAAVEHEPSGVLRIVNEVQLSRSRPSGSAPP